MKFNARITGRTVEAEYSEKSMENVFLPLIAKMKEIRKAKGRRILVFLAAPPAAGKSTMAAFLSFLCPEIQVLPMDGFHRRQEYLLTHSILRDGEMIPMVQIKGAPSTFDLEKLTASVQRAASGEVFGWPAYDRNLHNPVENAMNTEGDILILEGNYLLLDKTGWRELKQYADYSIRIEAPDNLLRRRLIERKLAGGYSPEAACEFVENSDMRNAALCMSRSLKADLTLRLTENGEYEKVPV